MKDPRTRSFGVDFELTRLVYEGNSEFQHILVGETEEFGRVLLLDGALQSAESDEAIYHETYVHPAVVAHGAVRRVLVGGAGEGAILRELLKHSAIESIVAVDIDRKAVEICREHLPSWSRGAFDDPRVELRFEDIEDTLREAVARPFDLIIMDVTEPIEGGPAEALFQPAFFERVAAAMAKDALVVVQAGEVDPWRMDNARSVVEMLGQVFGSVRLAHFYVPSFLTPWGAAICAKEVGRELVPADLEAKVAALEAQLGGEGLEVYDATWHRACVHLPRMYRRRLASPGG